jgi:hypothetical protein
MLKKIRGIYKGTISKKGEYGVAPKMLFIDLHANDKFLCSSYEFSLLKCFKSLNIKPSNLIEFEATIENEGGLKIKRPKNINKIDLSFLHEPFNYCSNKFIKKKKALSRDEMKSEKIAFIRMYNNYGDDFNFWKFLTLGFELNSLNWFLTPKGEEFVRENLKQYNKNNVDIPEIKPKYTLEDEIIAQKVQINKPKTILQFLN